MWLLFGKAFIHSYITYKREQYWEKCVDPDVEKYLSYVSSYNNDVTQSIREYEKLKKAFTDEKHRIGQLTAKLSRFLKEYAIVFYNDAVESYMKDLIERSKDIEGDSTLVIVNQLDKMLRNQQEQVELLHQSHVQPIEEENSNDTELYNIKVDITDLFQLVFSGQSIREAFNIQKRMHQTLEMNDTCVIKCSKNNTSNKLIVHLI